MKGFIRRYAGRSGRTSPIASAAGAVCRAMGAGWPSVLHQAIEDGRDPFTERLFSESKGFAQEIISLRSDKQVYTQDVKGGVRLKVRLPDAARDQGRVPH